MAPDEIEVEEKTKSTWLVKNYKMVTVVVLFLISFGASVWKASDVLATKGYVDSVGTTLVQYITVNRQLLDANSSKTNIVNNIRTITTQIQDLKNLKRKYPTDDEVAQDLADAKVRLEKEEDELKAVDKEIKTILTPK